MSSEEGLRKRGPLIGDPSSAATTHASTTVAKQDADLKKTQAPVAFGYVKASMSCRFLLQYPESDLLTLAIFTVLAFFTRFYKLSWADFVVWDEAHFGKFASYYIKREFYHDVHPPLGKMLLGFSGLLAGYNGTFEFESGAKYPSELNYTIMRMFAAAFGALMVPLAYLTAVQLRMSYMGCVLAGLMVLTDVATLNISRFILLDSMLLFFTSLTLYTLVTFRNHQKANPFSEEWWFWLAATGVSIGCVVSVKWVGLFAIALVGLYTVQDLWVMLGDLKMPKVVYAKHWMARIVFLIILPISIYIGSFLVHFAILNRSGTGDANMSSLFQAGLKGNNFDDNPLELAFGSKVTIKNNGPGGGLLHSHVQTFPTGSQQQQVTCYHHKDTNNDWIITKNWNELNKTTTEQVEFVKNGDIIRLVHAQTKRNLHSHPVKAPVTVAENEVSCYGDDKLGDINDHWKVEFVSDVTGDTKGRIRSLSTRFRLRHVVTNCLLRSHSVPLPQWGFKQNEVLCQKNGDLKSDYNIWNIEQHWNSQLPPAGPGAFKSYFWKDFIDLNVAMWTTNNALTPDTEKEPDQLVSQPWQWPFALVGLRMCSWDENAVKFYLLGHPVIWWGSALSVGVFAFLVLFYVIRFKRRFNDFTAVLPWDDFTFAGLVGWGGWFLHYLPFWIMGRVTYLHHYFPALYFGIFLLTYTLDHLCYRVLPSRLRPVALALVGAIILAVFVYFADFAFGFTGPASAYKNRRWLKTWNIYDGFDREEGEEHLFDAADEEVETVYDD